MIAFGGEVSVRAEPRLHGEAPLVYVRVRLGFRHRDGRDADVGFEKRTERRRGGRFSVRRRRSEVRPERVRAADAAEVVAHHRAGALVEVEVVRRPRDVPVIRAAHPFHVLGAQRDAAPGGEKTEETLGDVNDLTSRRVERVRRVWNVAHRPARVRERRNAGVGARRAAVQFEQFAAVPLLAVHVQLHVRAVVRHDNLRGPGESRRLQRRPVRDNRGRELAQARESKYEVVDVYARVRGGRDGQEAGNVEQVGVDRADQIRARPNRERVRAAQAQVPGGRDGVGARELRLV
mmetsp:Transcript_5242/g.21165  ORF Transcript_5242/g.21165 Transcript_5242/m.21165 type:complete len:291 (-) Transcript_5242:1594-2466(-)